MDTNDLINSLSQDLRPVKRMPGAAMRAAGLVAQVLVLVAIALMFLGGPRANWNMAINHDTALMLVAAVAAAVAACKLAVPDTKIRGATWALLGTAVLIWGYLCGKAFLALTPGALHNELTSAATSISCVIGLVMMTTVPMLVALWTVLRGHPVWRGWAGFAALLSAASFGAIGMRFLCSNDGMSHLLFWHFLPVFAFAFMGVALGKIILRGGV